MAGAENKHGPAVYLTEDIVINILLRLPVAACIARFRCVCKSWRNLLSDPNFIRKTLFFRNSDDEKSLQVLIIGSGSSPPDILGICDGIVCMAYTFVDASYCVVPCNIILWNPATSEAKILPPCPVHPVGTPWQRPLMVNGEYAGFGFNPQTKDYKVIRLLEFYAVGLEDDDREYHFEESQIHTGPWNPLFLEVYSLKNDSWKTLDFDHDKIQNFFMYASSSVWQYTSRKEKCYWYCSFSPSVVNSYDVVPVFDIMSFDMSDEVFELVTVPRPAAVDSDMWSARSCYMLKGVFVVNWSRGLHYEIWGLLKHGVAESWTKLPSFTPLRTYIADLEFCWKDGRKIVQCAYGRVFLYDPATGELVRANLQMERSSRINFVHVIAPTHVSLTLAG
ncbi:F-box protein At3g07870 [Linum grandiflorum]